MAAKTQHISDLNTRVASDASQDVKDMIEQGIDQFSNDYVGETRTACFVTVYDGDKLVGGLRGESLGAWFYIKHLWVAEEHRKQGLGKDLMKSAEQEAKARDCQTIWVDTLSYQAPDFYQKLGYDVAARVPNYRGSYDRIFFRKDI